MTRLVVDASAVLHLTGEANEVADEHELVAPTLLRSQTLSVLHEAVRRGEIPADAAPAGRPFSPCGLFVGGASATQILLPIKSCTVGIRRPRSWRQVSQIERPQHQERFEPGARQAACSPCLRVRKV